MTLVNDAALPTLSTFEFDSHSDPQLKFAQIIGIQLRYTDSSELNKGRSYGFVDVI